ncbi:VWA domain-containing protein [Acidicapsa acidisoli]|uniref:VWA domain-containing protein n=1 Tax=Acidicapsa acidisoli TaxID=1615681 RepID=UPI0021E0F065|nr:VWA domain-containing protein [Acidicapsa acidisoli]
MRDSLRFRTAFFNATMVAGLSIATAFTMDQPLLFGQQLLLSPGSEAVERPVIQPVLDEISASADGNDESFYGRGTQAIQEGRWADAEAIFDKIAQRPGEHAEGALYWKAYAQSKGGKSEVALKTCEQLRKGYPKSKWIDDCDAMEIEIRSRSGQPVDPMNEKDENLKLLALNALMHQDEARALPQIRRILSGGQSEIFKEHALFVLTQSSSKAAQEMLAEVANPSAGEATSIQSNLALRQRAQQLIAASHSASGSSGRTGRELGIDLTVSDAAGRPITGLSADNFTLLDNGQPRKILGFHEMRRTAAKPGDTTDPPTEVMIVIDTINEPLLGFAYIRDEVETFLKMDDGRLTHPVSLFIVDGKDAERLAPASQDGKALAATLEKAGTGKRPIRRSSGFVGVLPRAQMSLAALGSLAVEEATKPGRKMLIWISPGWDTVSIDDDWMIDIQRYRDLAPLFETRKAMFAGIVALSTGLRQARIQMYCIKPDHSGGLASTVWDRYKIHLNGVTQPGKAGTGDLSLQVLAVQSGGQAVDSTNDYLSGVIAKTITGAEADYFVTFDAPPAERLDEFHTLKITVNKPGLIVRTRHGYYDEP